MRRDCSAPKLRSGSSRRIHLQVHFWLILMLSMISKTGAVHHMKRAPLAWVSPRDSSVPLVVSNLCTETIYPGIVTQAGTPPSTGGFELNTGGSKNLTVSSDWQGRVWGRTNCSFNVQGTGPANTGGLNGGGQACGTGDCNGIVNCMVTVCFNMSRAWSVDFGINTFDRAIHPSPLWNLPLPPPVVKPSTTFHLSMATTFPSPSSLCIPNPVIPSWHRSLRIS